VLCDPAAEYDVERPATAGDEDGDDADDIVGHQPTPRQDVDAGRGQGHPDEIKQAT
jgi:hypothetical protein